MAVRSNNKVLIEEILSEDFILDNNYVFNYRLQEAIARDSFIETDEYPYPQSTISNPEEGTVNVIEKRKLTPFLENVEKKNFEWNLLMSKTIMDLDEYTGDLFDIIRILWTEQKQKDSSDMISLTVDDILQFREETPRKFRTDGSPVYHKEKRIKAAKELTKLFGLTLSLGKKLDDVEVDEKTGIVLNVYETEEIRSLFYIGDYTLLRENGEPIGFEQVYVRPGNILMENLGIENPENMRLMSQQALKYHYRHQKYHKRLTRYLNLVWELNEKLKQISLYAYPINGEKGLLNVMGFKITENVRKKPSLLLDEFTRVLDDLTNDGVIGSWRYAAKGGLDWERLEQRGWLEDYFLKQRVIIVPPNKYAPYFKVGEKELEALQNYLSVANEVKMVVKKEIKLRPDIIRNIKDKLNLSDRQISKEAGVGQATISRFVAAEDISETNLRPTTEEKILAWLEKILPELERTY
ncbi:hypothetical protein EKG37_17560 [Robertmurraya yapensis]|uniref:Uncharacterized protein n=3 Tax=Bacillaceae TaxID=186817 RepID=A0A3S0JSM2_9BACI|nr:MULTISPECIES: hypothetical protein [Bacillaceae]RTR28111.1 hypothetical protein EKG37_17560 [Bacillus yapensis]TKC15168.1 hypothetical protein FA727_20010 [Robertmurraya kyonggiensis]TKS94353.1 hypothetical protein FAR12_17560 [Bacillus yapensis]